MKTATTLVQAALKVFNLYPVRRNRFDRLKVFAVDGVAPVPGLGDVTSRNASQK